MKKAIQNFFNDFKEFVMRGNVIDLAIAVIIGAAFQKIVSSLVDNIISPVLGLFTKMNFDQLKLVIGEGETKVVIGYGSFFTAAINFIIMAFVIFLLLKGMNKLLSLTKKEEPEEEPTAKTCPYCITEINLLATRCPNCTSMLLEETEKAEEAETETRPEIKE